MEVLVRHGDLCEESNELMACSAKCVRAHPHKTMQSRISTGPGIEITAPPRSAFVWPQECSSQGKLCMPIFCERYVAPSTKKYTALDN